MFLISYMDLNLVVIILFFFWHFLDEHLDEIVLSVLFFLFALHLFDERIVLIFDHMLTFGIVEKGDDFRPFFALLDYKLEEL